MRNKMDELLKTALTPMDVPEDTLNNLVLSKAKERDNMTSKSKLQRRRISAAACFAACILVMGSITAVAAYRILSPKEVAVELKDSKLEKAFQSDGAVLVNETQESGEYRITLLGSVAGKNISDYLTWNENNVVEDNKIYTVVAIEHADGTPMPDTSSDNYGKETFFVSHYIQGLNPNQYSIMNMGGGYQEFVKDGIQYRLLEMDNIEMFADHEIYVGVSSGVFYDSNAYVYEESTGKMTRNQKYEGVNALFILPVDKSKADPAATKAYLESLNESSDIGEMPEELDASAQDVEAFMEKLTVDNIDEYAVPIESTRQVCAVSKDGWAHYAYELENDSGEGDINVSEQFPDGKPGMSDCFGYSYTENGLSSLLIDTFTLNEDGTVTYVVYVPKEHK